MDARRVVGIGASAGGLEALEQLFGNLPADTGNAYVVVQHLSPDFRSLMDELIARRTAMPVVMATDGVRLAANHVYVMPPGKHMIVRGAAEHQRGAAVGQRGALHGQCRAPAPARRATRALRRRQPPARGHRHRDVISRPRSADPPVHEPHRDRVPVQAADVGRHIGDFAHSLVRPQLFDEIAAVRDGGPPVEDEVRDTDGRIYFLRILPHRTARARA